MATKKTTTKKTTKPKATKPAENDPVQAVRSTHTEGSDKSAWPEVEKR